MNDKNLWLGSGAALSLVQLWLQPLNFFSKIYFRKLYFSLRLSDGTQESHLVSEIKYLASIFNSWFYHTLLYIGHRKNVLMNFRKFISQEQHVSFSEALFVSIFTYSSNNK